MAAKNKSKKKDGFTWEGVVYVLGNRLLNEGYGYAVLLLLLMLGLFWLVPEDEKVTFLGSMLSSYLTFTIETILIIGLCFGWWYHVRQIESRNKQELERVTKVRDDAQSACMNRHVKSSSKKGLKNG